MRSQVNRFIHCAAFVGLLTIVALTPNARSQDQDIVGIYFDEAGVLTSYETTDLEFVTVFLLVKNVSAESGMAGVALAGGWGIPEERFSACPFYGGSVGCEEVWVFSAPPPDPGSDVVPVAFVERLVTSANDRIEIFVQPLAEAPFYFSQAMYQTNDVPPQILPLYPSSGSYDLPVAVINPQAVAVNSESWGAVKSLFR